MQTEIPREAQYSEAVTRDVRVQVESIYVPERSLPEQGAYVFAYHVRISNEGEETVQLTHRHWMITNAEGKVEEVRGEGVVGEQPVLEAGEFFEYTSFCPLNTATGSMRGSYRMVTESGESFEAEIALFRLSGPGVTYH